MLHHPRHSIVAWKPEARAEGIRIDRPKASPLPLGSQSLRLKGRSPTVVSVPTILRIRGFRIGFYCADLAEPIHVHVRRQGGEAKYWINPIELAQSKGFRPHELSDIQRILEKHRDQILAAWQLAEVQRGDSSSQGQD